MSTREVTQLDQVVDILNAAQGALPRAELVERVDFSESRLDNVLAQLLDEGRVEKPKRGVYNIVENTYSSTSSGPAAQSTAGVAPASPASSLTDLFQDDVELDVYTNIRVEAGDGRVAYPDEAKRKITIPREFISKIIGFVPPKEVGLMVVGGDSMHPTIQEDDMVLWRPVEEVQASGVYVLSVDGKLRCKRVDPIPGGGLRLISDNDFHGYPNYTLKPQNGELVNEDTGAVVDLYPVGKVIFPRRDTDRMDVKQVAEIVRSVAGGDVNLKSTTQ